MGVTILFAPVAATSSARPTIGMETETETEPDTLPTVSASPLDSDSSTITEEISLLSSSSIHSPPSLLSTASVTSSPSTTTISSPPSSPTISSTAIYLVLGIFMFFGIMCALVTSPGLVERGRRWVRTLRQRHRLDGAGSEDCRGHRQTEPATEQTSGPGAGPEPEPESGMLV